jgi:glycosyltransferase involved in cell wall biosynthesis
MRLDSTVADGDKVRVMRIFSRLNVGGPSIHVVLLSSGLDPERYDTTLVIGREGYREGSLRDYALEHGVSPIVLPTLGREIHPIRDFLSFLSLCRLMSRLRPQIVHTHTAKAGALGRLAALLTGVPVVVHTFHGTVFSGYFGKVGSTLYGFVERLLARWTDAVVAVSPAIARELQSQRLAPRRSLETIPLGLELARFTRHIPSNGLRDELGFDRADKLVGFVGRLVAIKDVPTLLAALPLVQRRVPSARLVLVGDGPERESLQRFVHEQGIEAWVRFLGFRTDLEHVYPALDVVVNSSLNEGTPVALIEAMAAGIPVVATEVGGTPDVLEYGALGEMVPPRNPGKLAEAIERCLRGGTAVTSKTALGRERAIQRYGSARLCRDIEALYSRLLAVRKGAASEPTKRTLNHSI